MHIPYVPCILRKFLPDDITWSFRAGKSFDQDRETTTGKSIYITFDDGPIPEVTPLVLDILTEYEAKATFFCVGNNVSKYPDVFRRIVNDGHSVGNHTFSHLNGFKSDTGEYLEDIEKCNSLINSNLFRPPHGRMKITQYKAVKDKYRIIMWSVLTGDYNKKLSKEEVLNNALKYTKEGSIIVFHDSLKAAESMLYALPAMLKHFSQRGYQFKAINQEPL